MPASTPPCDRPGCPQTAGVQWQRRSAADPTHTITVYACLDDAIHLDAAALIHAVTCPAPDPALLPDCGCTPEPAPVPAPAPSTVTLSTGWTIAAP